MKLSKCAIDYLKSNGLNDTDIEFLFYSDSVYEETKEDFINFWIETNKRNGEPHTTKEDILENFDLYCGGGNNAFFHAVELENGNILTCFLEF